MRIRTLWTLLATAVLVGVAGSAAGQVNPCKPKNPCNPCNPCKAKNPCNPCGMKGAAPKKLAVNPCHAKMGTVFYVADPMGRDHVSFTSEAPLEDIVGTTNQLSGYLVFDPHRAQSGIRGKFVVPVKSLNTGIPLRDEHLQSADWMNAAAYPDITFEIENARNIRLVKQGADYQTYDLSLYGPMTIRGVTRTIEVPARVTFLKESPQTMSRLPGDLLAVRANYQVPLKSFGITGGQMGQVIGSKVGETVSIEVRCTGCSKDPTQAMNPCNPCNPCKGKNPCNPCKGKNPCNPCKGKNPCNPCKGKGKGAAE